MSQGSTEYLGRVGAEGFSSLGSMEGVYEPIVEITYLDLAPDAAASLGAMEGLSRPVVFAPAPSVTPAGEAEHKKVRHWPGYTLAAAAATGAFALSSLSIVPVSAAILAILVGVLVRNLLPIPDGVTPGCKRIVKTVIPLAIVLTGAGLNLTHIADVGPQAMLIIILCMVIAILAACFFGRLCGLQTRAAMLIGAGTGICGNSAIVAVAPLIDADDRDLVLSVGTINLFGLLAMLICPLVGGMLDMGNNAFGVWSGTTIHAVPQVVAAGFAFSPESGTLATLVKLVRVALLAPLVAILAVQYARRHTADIEKGRSVVVHYARFVPWFVWGFVALALLRTMGLIPTLDFQLADVLTASSGKVEIPLTDVLSKAAKVLLTLAMAAIGIEINIRLLAGVGSKALLTGLLAFATLAAASLLLIMLLL